MELITDLHIHSHYSRATSKSCDFEGLYYWGKLKGINIIGTGDFTHPDWFAEMHRKLEPAEEGLLKLKESLAREIDKKLPQSVRSSLLRFVPSVEISTIYSKGGKVRRLHQLVVMPSLEAVSMFNMQLSAIGNLRADGRPIIGMDSKELLRLALETSSDSLFIPAHIWTPWFGLFGSKSGFDSLAEAYEELTPEIRAIETGLSSDPAMNWRVGDLDSLAILSNSDAHSPQKLGREASVLHCGLSYRDIVGAIKTNDHRFVGTIEFFPEEGKYHADGHRACGVRFSPSQTLQHNGVCPRCTRPLVIGVNYRVNELATRPAGYQPAKAKQVEYCIPLAEIIAEIKQVKSVSSRAVQLELFKVYEVFGDEFTFLRKISIETIEAQGFSLLGEAVKRLRNREVEVDPGYDGIYGLVKVFKNSPDPLDLNANWSQ